MELKSVKRNIGQVMENYRKKKVQQLPEKY